MTWRERSRAVCEAVLRENERPADPEKLRALLNAHYPFGAREMHPYDAWLRVLDEYCGPSPKKAAAQKAKLDAIKASIGQESLF